MRRRMISTLLFAVLLSACSNNVSNGVKTDDGLSPLMNAAKEGDAERLRGLLSDNPAALNDIQERSGETALSYAISSDNKAKRLQLVNLLLEAGANPEIIGSNSTPPLSLSILEGERMIFDVLMQRKPNIEIGDWDGSTPLMYAAANGQLDMIDALLGAGANVNKRDNNALYPIDHALIMGKADVAAYLQTRDGKSALDTVKTAEDAVKLMKEAKVEETQDYLYFQVVYNNLFLTKLMLTAGYALDYRMNEMIYDHASKNNREMMKLLLEAGADPDEDDETTGTTALMNAAKNGHAEVVELLLTYKADPDIRDQEGKTALDYAKESNHQAIVDLLLTPYSQVQVQEQGKVTIGDGVKNTEEVVEGSPEKQRILQELLEVATQGYIKGIKYGVDSDTIDLFTDWGKPQLQEGSIYHYDACGCLFFINDSIEYVGIEGENVGIDNLTREELIAALGQPDEEYSEGGTSEMSYSANDYVFTVGLDYSNGVSQDDPPEVQFFVSKS